MIGDREDSPVSLLLDLRSALGLWFGLAVGRQRDTGGAFGRRGAAIVLLEDLIAGQGGGILLEMLVNDGDELFLAQTVDAGVCQYCRTCEDIVCVSRGLTRSVRRVQRELRARACVVYQASHSLLQCENVMGRVAEVRRLGSRV